MLDLLEDRTANDERVQAVRLADLEREEKTRRNAVRFIRAMWIVVAMLLLFNSSQLVTVVNGFGVGPLQDAVVALSTTWNEQMEKNGLTKPVAIIRATVERWRSTDWTELKASIAPQTPRREGAIELRGALGDAKG